MGSTPLTTIGTASHPKADEDFDSRHPEQNFKVFSQSLNLQAPANNPIIKDIQNSTSICDVSHLSHLKEMISSTQIYEAVTTVPEQDDGYQVNLVTNPRQRGRWPNVKINCDKPNAISIHHKTRNLFNNFSQLQVGYRNRWDTESNSLFFNFLSRNSPRSWRLISCNWKKKRTDENTKSGSVTARWTWMRRRQAYFQGLVFRLQNRRSEVNMSNVRSIQSSNLCQVGLFDLDLNPGRNVSMTQLRLGFVPAKGSFFVKLNAYRQFVKSLGQTIVKTGHHLDLVLGKNLTTQDLIEYQPLRRAQFILTNRVTAYFPSYTLKSQPSNVSIFPYIYILNWLSINNKRFQKLKSECEIGVGLELRIPNDGLLRLQFSRLQLTNTRFSWAHRFSVQFFTI